MRFTKKDNVYRISQVTGSQDNILGVCFSENNSNDIQVIVNKRLYKIRFLKPSELPLCVYMMGEHFIITPKVSKLIK